MSRAAWSGRARRPRGGALSAAALLAAALSGAALLAAARPALAQVSAPPPAPAERAAAPLRLEDVLQSAERAHPLLVAAAQERAYAEGELQAAEGGFDMSWRTRAAVAPLGYYRTGRVDSFVELPTEIWGATMIAGYRWGSDTFPEYDGKLVTNPLGEVRAGAAVPLWRNGPIDRRRANIQRAELGLPLAELTVAQQRIEIARAAALRYWDWVAAGRKLAIALEARDIAVARDEALLERVARGDTAEVERTDNQRAILQRDQQRVAAQRTLEQAALELALFLRRPDGAPLPPAPARLPAAFPEPAAAPPPVEGALGAARARRPEIGRVERQREQARVERALADNQRAPAIDLQVVVSQDLGDGSEKRRPLELEASVLLDIPLETNAARGRMRVADAQLARLEAQRRFAVERVETDVRDAASAIRAAIERIQIARRELELARRLERGERDKLELGDSTMVLVNLREQATVDAAVREVDALADYHKGAAALEAATGGAVAAPRRAAAAGAASRR